MTMVSTCTPDTEEYMHLFEIVGYSKHRGMGHGKFSYVRSGIFTVGGSDWSIRCYPDGYSSKASNEILDQFVSVYLVLMSNEAQVRASCDLSLLDRSTESWTSVHKTGPRIFEFGKPTAFAPSGNKFMTRSELESPRYLEEDHLTIRCVLTVFKTPHVATTKLLNKIKVPPSNITENLGRLLEREEHTDVTFCVGGERFAAHRLVLAMRSPFFKAELYGRMVEGRSPIVTIEDMQPAVFRALLRFIYTDSLPDDMDYQEGSDATIEMTRHLIVAADRYAVDRLKLMCESILSEKLDVETVVTTWALADQYNCGRLKDACLEFLTTSDVMDAVKATTGYKNLKETCPSALVDAYEKAQWQNFSSSSQRPDSFGILWTHSLQIRF